MYLTEGTASYQSEKSHNVQSNFSEGSERAFEVKKLKQTCPQDPVSIEQLAPINFLELKASLEASHAIENEKL